MSRNGRDRIPAYVERFQPPLMSNVARLTQSLAVALATTLVSACSGPYADLEGSFKASQPASAPAVSVEQVVLVSTHEVGAHRYDDVLAVKLLPTAIAIEPSFPWSIGMSPVSIAVDEVAGCSRSCFGDGVWDAELLVARTGTQISLRNSKELIEWCWSNRIPMISGNDRRQWLYKGASLPDRSEFSEQLASRKNYDAQAKQSCLGY
ncbi:hypothetical protein [Rhizobacter sp. OV335]|uniref:hypothetical protein n=1 Tax=Rhizobacter sp. OV335 TaxID=1500264 RepID=UPI001161216D|nr:hypothetical protein [Rhizobacter sp. OV335]